MPNRLDSQNSQNLPLQQLRALLRASDDAVWSITPEGLIALWNWRVEELFEYSMDEIARCTLSLLLPPGKAEEDREIASLLARGERLENHETHRLAKSGKPVAIALSVVPVRDENGLLLQSLYIARKRTVSQDAQTTTSAAQEEAGDTLETLRAGNQHRALVLEMANRVALDILANRTGIEALRHIADAARILAGARYAALGVANSDGSALREFITVGLTPEQEAAIGTHPRGQGVLGLLLHRTTPLRINALAQHPASVGFPAHHPPMESFLGVPIRRGDVVLGSLYLTNKQGGAFTQSDEMSVEALGAHAAVAIHNLQMLSRQSDLVRGLMTAQDEERRAVAYDLHDGLTQFVMASHAHLQSFERAHRKGQNEKAEREIEHSLKLLNDAVVESRRLVNGLRALALDDLGLAGALELLVNEEKERAGWNEAEVVHNIAGRRFDRAFETGAYRIAQEALTNCRKHAQTERVEVLAQWQHKPGGAPQLTLEVRDWGCGFAPDQRTNEYGHVGLSGMIERAHLLGGQMNIHTVLGEGTLVRVTIPVLELPFIEPASAEPRANEWKVE